MQPALEDIVDRVAQEGPNGGLLRRKLHPVVSILPPDKLAYDPFMSPEQAMRASKRRASYQC